MKSLIARALQTGDMTELSVLLDNYRQRIHEIALHITNSNADAEDIVQDTILQVLQKIGQYRGENFEGWLFRITKNRAIDFLRKRSRAKYFKRPRIELPILESMMQQEQKSAINQILKKLPHAQREIIYQRHIQNRSIREIAENRQCAEGTVKATLFQTLQKLKKEFKSAGIM